MITPRNSFAIDWIRKMVIVHKRVAWTLVNDSTAFYKTEMIIFLTTRERKPCILFRLFKIVRIVPINFTQIEHPERDRIVIANYFSSKEKFSLTFWFLKLPSFCELDDATEDNSANLDKKSGLYSLFFRLTLRVCSVSIWISSCD